MRWTFWCTPEQADAVAEGLCATDFFSFTRSTLPVKSRPIPADPLGEFVEIYTGEDVLELPPAITELFRSFHVGIACVTRDETEGPEDWKRHFTPQHIVGVGDVLPPWEWSPLARFSRGGGTERGADVLIIEPEMAFGTGSHATTQVGLQALAWLREQDPPGAWTSMLDAGTGSGIYSLYGRKLGVPFVLACDVDGEVFSNLKKNFALNHVPCPTEVGVDVAQVYGTFDWVFVNISCEIILSQMAHLCGWVGSRGYLFLTGFLSDDQKNIERVLEKSSSAFHRVWCRTQAEWSGMLLKKNECAETS